MKLDRNTNPDRRGKYGLILQRVLAQLENDPEVKHAIEVLEKANVIDWGGTPSTDFFVIRLKDKYAAPALGAYALAAWPDDPEYGYEISDLGRKAASYTPKRRPD